MPSLDRLPEVVLSLSHTLAVLQLSREFGVNSRGAAVSRSEFRNEFGAAGAAVPRDLCISESVPGGVPESCRVSCGVSSEVSSGVSSRMSSGTHFGTHLVAETDFGIHPVAKPDSGTDFTTQKPRHL